jgi:hypothetical protein
VPAPSLWHAVAIGGWWSATALRLGVAQHFAALTEEIAWPHIPKISRPRPARTCTSTTIRLSTTTQVCQLVTRYSIRLPYDTDFLSSQSYRQNEYVHTHPVPMSNRFRCPCPFFPAPDSRLLDEIQQLSSRNHTAVISCRRFGTHFRRDLRMFGWDSCADAQLQPRVPPASASGMFTSCLEVPRMGDRF